MTTYEPAQPDEAPGLLKINDELAIREDELRFRFSRSSGPGGQHVNRSETRVELLFDVANSPSLTETQRATLSSRLGRLLDSNGTLRVVSSSSRSQAENRAEAVSRFQALLASALRRKKKRLPTGPSRAARERRISDKKMRGAIKERRRDVRHTGDE